MKNLILGFLLSFASIFSFGQTFKTGTKIIEVGSSTLDQRIVPTGFGYYSTAGGLKSVSVGLQGGYFIANNLAVKTGLGYANTHKDGKTYLNSFGYNAGLEYYFFEKIPVQVLWSGATVKGLPNNPSFISTQLGYAFVVNDWLVLKPVVRYDQTLNDHYNSGWGAGFSAGVKF